MSNMLRNGTVLPSGLLSGMSTSAQDSFKRTFQNTALRVGIVIQSYGVNDPNNVSKTVAEYDVLTMEQNGDQGSTPITYKHCMAASGFGSIADFFEATLRKMDKKPANGATPDFSGQNGAIVLLLCLNGMSDTGIVISFLGHPDRPTTLTNAEPQLEGEYNGVNIKVNTDGSTTLTFKGATDNDGDVIDSSQGNTVISIEKDGTFQAMNDQITFRMDRTTSQATLNAKKDINLVTGTNLNVTATANVVVKCVDVDVNASGKANVQIGADATVQVGGNCDLTVSGTLKETAKEIDLNGNISGITTFNSHQGVIDFITGVPVQPSETVKSDV